MGKSWNPTEKRNRREIIEGIYVALISKGLDHEGADKYIARSLRVKENTVSKWRSGVSLPTDDHFQGLIQLLQRLEDSAAQQGKAGGDDAGIRKTKRKQNSAIPVDLSRGDRPEINDLLQAENIIANLDLDGILRVSTAVTRRLAELNPKK